MKFKEREVEHPKRRRLYIIDENTGEQLPIEQSMLVDIEREEGDFLNDNKGTAVTVEDLNKGNWRDDKSVSFAKLSDGEDLPPAKANQTQIVTTYDGEVWVIPPEDNESSVESRNFKLGGQSTTSNIDLSDLYLKLFGVLETYPVAGTSVMELIIALQQGKLDKDETVKDSLKLGGELPAYYASKGELDNKIYVASNEASAQQYSAAHPTTLVIYPD